MFQIPRLPKVGLIKWLAIPVLLFVAGVLSNQVVLVANWGKFPVMVNHRQLQTILRNQAEANSDEESRLGFIVPKESPKFDVLDTEVNPKDIQVDSDGMIDDVHCVMGHNSRLKFLADWINLGNIWSPGDMLIELGELMALFGIWVYGTILSAIALSRIGIEIQAHL